MMADSTNASDLSRRRTIVVSLFAGLGIVSAIRLLRWYWPGSFFHNAASGTWTALAWDFAHGELYRPVLSASGFGGTRYMPVLFMLHGWLIRMHMDPIRAGVLLMQASVVTAAIGLYVALHAANVRAAVAWPFALTLWASVTYEKFCTDLRVDYLAATFVIVAIAAATVATRDSRQRWLWLAGAACLLAVFSKLTEAVFVVTVAMALATGSSWKRSASFFGATLAASLLLFAMLQWASAGRFAENLQSTLTAGTQLSGLWRRGAPMLLRQLVGDPLIGGPFVLAAWSVFVAVRRGDWSMADSYFVTAAVLTCVIYASPGTSSNHMIEVQMATACAVAVGVGRGRLTDRVVVTTYGALAVVMIALGLPLLWMPSPMRTLRLLGPHQRSTIDAVQADFLSSKQYLSLDPIVPMLLHQRPIVLDPFNLGLFVADNTPAGRSFDSRIHSRSFATVIADDDEGVFGRDLDPDDAGFAEAVARFWAASTPLIKLIGNDYEIRAVRRPFVILQPRGGGDVYLGNGS